MAVVLMKMVKAKKHNAPFAVKQYLARMLYQKMYIQWYLFLILPFACARVSGQSNLDIARLTDNFYVFTTYKTFDGMRFPANGMYVVTDAGVVMIDMPWDTTQARPLLDSIESRHHKMVVLSISTHYHDDRTGAVNILKDNGVKTWCSKLTYQYCTDSGENRPQYYFQHDTTFTIGGVELQTYYPGPGHTPDNIVVWFPARRVLYGGCFVKSTEAQSLGNLADANVKAWPQSIKNVQQRFKKVNYIIPGHQGWQGTRHLKHTLKLLKKYSRN